MKAKYLLLFAALALVTCLAACKKGSNYPIVGKWQQVKLRTYIQSYSGAVSHDTTYLSSSFNNTNYAQFNNDGTCVIGLYYSPGSINPISEIAYPSIQNYNYAVYGSKYVMTIPTAPNAATGFFPSDTASVSANTLLIHSVIDNHQDYTVLDSYYTK